LKASTLSRLENSAARRPKATALTSTAVRKTSATFCTLRKRASSTPHPAAAPTSPDETR